ncbi:HalOD1 output domain-containing protein [Haladaptatus sp. W1]|uniref:HalOD1 output domain-containing protein n=1 Tax=Haladaptatus sp. W1 TaxID=1897478 RepID=UPI001586CB58
MSVRNEASTFSSTGRSEASTVIIEALREYDGIDVERGEFRLYDFIDPDALNSIFSHRPTASISIQFDIHETTITVWRTDDTIQVHVENCGE